MLLEPAPGGATTVDWPSVKLVHGCGGGSWWSVKTLSASVT